ncbi:MutS-related protein [Psychroserpens ponticola]|uniref:DNA mismatch repair protein MutS n=1 Tax=Psychroserpens ponticola TaxID=2932268 RepID=A0ABY7RXG7_9FLAO|nr:DNA mismatch repair protein MutS [Psychroserpens ponticola]WCO01826.1 DNA mismatch repair protein MutS [Psychroserpens ponticola]
MIDPITFYNQELETYKTEVASHKKSLLILSSLRILIFALTGIAIYVTFSNWQLALAIGVLGLTSFIYLLSKYTNIKAKRELHKALVHINAEELKIASGDFHHRDTGLQFQDPKHFYSLDIDLFGKGSFFQFINRTISSEGQHELSNALKTNNTSNIEERQDAIKELSEKTEWTQLYSATGSLIKTETPALKIINWLKNHKGFIPKYMKLLPWLFTIISVTLLILSILNILDITYFGYWLFVGLGLTGLYLKKINVLAVNSDKAKDTFRQYASLLLQIENERFTSKLLQEKQKQIQSEGKKASAIFSEFSKHLDALDNRNNLIGAIFGNGYLLSDIKNAYKVEQWISKYGHKVEDWFEVVSFFDAYNSLGNYAFNHQDHVFPKISKNQITINSKNLGHPLLDKTKRINSDVSIKNQQFFIVTGANMAGKSTFLRTISLHIMMANVGLPVCATSSSYSPVKLITSMRTSDSLTDDSSYFFSELTRLKFIVDAIEKEPYFIILDEILKGTNSTDKAIGSRKFVEKLVAGNATGIIATHDLSLCKISEELDDVENYYFNAEIVNDELYFDYKFKKGICQNMNASFLLKKMEII